MANETQKRFKYVQSLNEIREMFEEESTKDFKFEVDWPNLTEKQEAWSQEHGYDFILVLNSEGSKPCQFGCAMYDDFHIYGEYHKLITSWLRAYMTKKHGKAYLADLKAALIKEATLTVDGYKKYLPQDEAE